MSDQFATVHFLNEQTVLRKLTKERREHQGVRALVSISGNSSTGCSQLLEGERLGETWDQAEPL